LVSEASWKTASPVPDSSPTVVSPVFETLKSVVVEFDVELATAKSNELNVPLYAWAESRANGEVDETPNFVPSNVRPVPDVTEVPLK
jgi:hypothetical protein